MPDDPHGFAAMDRLLASVKPTQIVVAGPYADGALEVAENMGHATLMHPDAGAYVYVLDRTYVEEYFAGVTEGT
jgi:hypothetical protein